MYMQHAETPALHFPKEYVCIPNGSQNTQGLFSETASVAGVMKTRRVLCDAGTAFVYFRWNLLVNFGRRILPLNNETVSFFPSAEDSGLAGASNPVTFIRKVDSCVQCEIAF